jgi:hypothetical protein
MYNSPDAVKLSVSFRAIIISINVFLLFYFKLIKLFNYYYYRIKIFHLSVIVRAASCLNITDPPLIYKLVSFRLTWALTNSPLLIR